MSRNSEPLQSFFNYCVEHPDERFWQALRNWSGYHVVYVSNAVGGSDDPGVMDTFYWEGRTERKVISNG